MDSGPWREMGPRMREDDKDAWRGIYVMIASLLFAGSAIKSGLVFMMAYILGISFALLMSWVFKKTLL